VSYDLEALVTGKAIYGMDARMDGMVYASVEHPPVLGGKVKSYDDKDALKSRVCVRLSRLIHSSHHRRFSRSGRRGNCG